MMTKLLHWMLIFESNVGVDHFVPPPCTTCSSPSAALASQKDAEQLPFATIAVPYLRISMSKILTQAIHHYCLTTHTTLIDLPVKEYYNTITEVDNPAYFFLANTLNSSFEASRNTHKTENVFLRTASAVSQFKQHVRTEKGEGARNYLHAASCTRT